MTLVAALALVGCVAAALIMMLVVVQIARGMDGGSQAPKSRADAVERERAAEAENSAGASLFSALKSGIESRRARKRRASGGLAAAITAIAVGGGIVASISKHAGADEPPTSREIAAGALHGTLLGVHKPREVVLIVPGSGPTDRNGDSPLGVKGGSYRLLAEGLAEKGVASVRIDKRGMFGSKGAGDPGAVSITVYSDDIHAWIDAIKAETGVKCVWLLGHSEGALMVSAAAEGRKDVCGLVLVSGAGRRLGDVLREQLKANPANASLLDAAFAALGELEAGRHVDVATLPPALLPLFNAKAQDFLISEIGVDPVELVRKAGKKTLIVQGSTDLQISVEDARRLSAAPRTTLQLIEGMNHVLKTAPADRAANIATYSNPDLPLAPGLVDAIARFVKDDDE